MKDFTDKKREVGLYPDGERAVFSLLPLGPISSSNDVSVGFETKKLRSLKELTNT